MSAKDKLIEKLKSKPKNFTFDEVTTLLKRMGYVLDHKGGTSGSRVIFRRNKEIIMLHKPHPQNTLKQYAIDDLINKLTDNGDL